MIKKYILDRRFTGAYERGLIEHITLEHLSNMYNKFLRAGLCSPREANDEVTALVHAMWPDASSIMMSSQAVVKHRTFTAGDVVLYQKSAVSLGIGELWFHSQADDAEPFSCVSAWAELADMGDAHTKTVSILENPVFMPAVDLRCPLIHRVFAEGKMQVIMPAEYA